MIQNIQGSQSLTSLEEMNLSSSLCFAPAVGPYESRVSLSLWKMELNLHGMAVAGLLHSISEKCLSHRGNYNGAQNYYPRARVSQFTFLLFYYLVVRPHNC